MTILFCETCRTSYHTRELADGTIEEYCLTCQLLAVLTEARDFIVSEYPRSSMAVGNWPTVKPLVDRLDACIAQGQAGSA